MSLFDNNYYGQVKGKSERGNRDSMDTLAMAFMTSVIGSSHRRDTPEKEEQRRLNAIEQLRRDTFRTYMVEIDKKYGKRRNSPCPCESGKKYKHCCIKLTFKDVEMRRIDYEEDGKKYYKFMILNRAPGLKE